MDPASVTLTITDAANFLGVSPQTVRRHIHAGLLQAEKVPGPRGTTYRVSLPISELSREHQVPDHVARALARTLYRLREAQNRVELLEQAHSMLRDQIRQLERELARARKEDGLASGDFRNGQASERPTAPPAA